MQNTRRSAILEKVQSNIALHPCEISFDLLFDNFQRHSSKKKARTIIFWNARFSPLAKRFWPVVHLLVCYLQMLLGNGNVLKWPEVFYVGGNVASIMSRNGAVIENLTKLLKIRPRRERRPVSGRNDIDGRWAVLIGLHWDQLFEWLSVVR